MKRPLCCVCIAFVATVFLYLQLCPEPPVVYPMDAGKKVTLIGEVFQKEYKDETLIFGIKDVCGWEPETDVSQDIKGVLCYLELDKSTVNLQLGSIVAVKGEIAYFAQARNPGSFDAQQYYQILGIDCKLYDAEILTQSSGGSLYQETLYRLRNYFEKIFERVLPEKEASIMKAMVLGNKSMLDRDSKDLYQRSGIAHVVAISGLHITLLGMGLYTVLRKGRLPQVIAVALSIGVMIAYGDMTGMSSSAYRAVFMFGMKLIANLLKRTYDMLTALAMAAVLILFEQPLYMYHTGFLLSFGAIFGVGCLSDVVTPARWKDGQTFQNRIASSLCGSLGIFLIQLPVMLCVYYELPVYSFLLNLIVIPAMGIVMIAGISCLVFGSLPTVVGLGLAQIAGMVCRILLGGFEELCKLFLRLPYAQWIVGRPKNWKIVIFLGVVLLIYIAHTVGIRISKNVWCRERGMNVIFPYSIRFIAILVAVAFISSHSIDGASIAFLDVGQGDCIWVESQKGEHFLIDGGSTSQNKVGEYIIVPYLKYMGVSRLDAVFLTHLDSDHISGVMEILEGDFGIDIDKICISHAVIEDEAYEKLVRLCTVRQIPLYKLQAGDSIEADQVKFEVLHPSIEYHAASRNASSLVMKLTLSKVKAQCFTALLTGDVEADGEQVVADYLTREQEVIHLYKAAHHGSKYSNTEALIMAAYPEIAVISCGENNRYGHPHVEALQNLYHVGSEILATKDTGAIIVKIKNGEYKVTHYWD